MSDEAGTDDTEAPRKRGLLAGRHASAAVVGVLTLLLGFAIAVQVHANSGSDALSGLREDDLVGILDDQDNRAERLRRQIAQLQQNLRQLRSSDNRTTAARRQAREEAAALGVLLGTVAAHGPGVVVTVADPNAKLGPEDLLDVVEELRGAGAEAIQFGSGSGDGSGSGSVRVATSTAFTGSAGAVQVDGTSLAAPYRVVAIGPPKTMDTALSIPGGAAATIRTEGGDVSVAERSRVSITATRALGKPRYSHTGN